MIVRNFEVGKVLGMPDSLFEKDSNNVDRVVKELVDCM